MLVMAALLYRSADVDSVTTQSRAPDADAPMAVR
jgi:hypothetical protein